MPTPSRPNVAEFYERTVLPALMGRLDEAFPEFGWQRDQRGWRATNQEFTHARLGARAERVVCHGEAPRGLLVHGDGPLLWTTYANDGTPARGRDFIHAVRLLAVRAGVDVSALDRAPTMRERQAAVLEATSTIARAELMSSRGAVARDYLTSQRGMPAETATHDLGLMPTGDRLRALLAARGYSAAEVAASGVTTDQRWAGRLVGTWRDDARAIGTMWARITGEEPDETAKYLYLAGHPRGHLPPYGLADAREAGSERLHLVEGLLDVHHLRAVGVRDVVALGGTSVTPGVFTALDAHGVQEVALCFDNDPAGRLATERAIDALTRAAQAPDVLVVDPHHYGAAKGRRRTRTGRRRYSVERIRQPRDVRDRVARGGPLQRRGAPPGRARGASRHRRMARQPTRTTRHRARSGGRGYQPDHATGCQRASPRLPSALLDVAAPGRRRRASSE
jgi:hypothetical protein